MLLWLTFQDVSTESNITEFRYFSVLVIVLIILVIQ